MEKIICSNCLMTIEEFTLNELICENCNKELLLNSRYQLIKIIGQNSGTTYIARDLAKPDFKDSPNIQEGTNNPNQNKKSTIGLDPLSISLYNPLDDPYQYNENLVVIKELSIKKMKRWKDEELFQRERVVLLNLDHPKIPKILNKFDKRVGKRVSYYTVIEYINGESLEKVIKKNKFPNTEVIKMLKEISEILEYMHSLNPPIIHRDLKPSNIMIKNKEYYLIDFGSVTDIVKEEGGSTIAGTFGYMAPEQFLGKSEKASDYYALGILSLEMLSGIPPEQFMIGDRINWKMLNISKKMKNILQPLLIYDFKSRIQSRYDLLYLINPPAKEREYNIVKILKKYEKIEFSFKKINKIFNISYVSISSIILLWILITKKNSSMIPLTIFYFMALTVLFFFFMGIKRNFFSRSLIKKMIIDNDNIELDVALASTFIEDKFRKKKHSKKYYYNRLEKRASDMLNIEKSLKYENDFKDKDFLKIHIDKFEEFGDSYLYELENRLQDKKCKNFNIDIKSLSNFDKK